VIQAEIPNKKEEKKEKLLKEVMVKIRLKQEGKEERITMEVLLNSGATRLVISLEFVKKNKLENLIHIV